MKRPVVLVVACVILLGLCALPARSQQQNVFMWGAVKWTTGNAAVGIEVRLVQEGMVKAVAHTNQAGHYVFFDIPGSPPPFVVRIYLGGQLLAETSREFLKDIPRGGKAPDILVQ